MIGIDREKDSPNQSIGLGAGVQEIMPGVDPSRDLRLEAGRGGLDLARVEGMEALGQALAVAPTTRLGMTCSTAVPDSTANAMVEERIRF